MSPPTRHEMASRFGGSETNIPPKLKHHLSSLDLLSALSEGNSPGGKVYAASFLTLHDIIKNIIGCEVDSTGTTHKVK